MMISSYGETELMIGARITGRVRLKAVEAHSSLGPTLTLGVGVQLNDVPEGAPGGEPLSGYMLTDLNGHLRLGERGPFVGSLAWTGRRGSVRSSAYGNEGDVQMTCELDWPRLEGLERLRNGSGLEFWLSMWPRLEVGSRFIPDVNVRPFRCQVPRDAWVPVLEKLRGDRIEILEVGIPTQADATFRASLSELKRAREYVDHGDYSGAIVRCRKGSEMLAIAVGGDGEVSKGVKDTLVPFVGQERAGFYADVLRTVKRLGNVELHQVVEHGYSRSEALFAIRTLSSLIELLGSILTRSREFPASDSTSGGLGGGG